MSDLKEIVKDGRLHGTFQAVVILSTLVFLVVFGAGTILLVLFPEQYLPQDAGQARAFWAFWIFLLMGLFAFLEDIYPARGLKRLATWLKNSRTVVVGAFFLLGALIFFVLPLLQSQGELFGLYILGALFAVQGIGMLWWLRRRALLQAESAK